MYRSEVRDTNDVRYILTYLLLQIFTLYYSFIYLLTYDDIAVIDIITANYIYRTYT